MAASQDVRIGRVAAIPHERIAKQDALVGLTNYSQPYQQVPMWGAAMAASTIATIPIACLFAFFQRYFIKGLTAAAIKG